MTVVPAKSRARGDTIAAANRFASFSLRPVSALLFGTASVLALAPPVAIAQTVPGALPSREQVLPPVPRTAPSPAEVRVDGTKAFRETVCPFEQSAERVTIGSVRFVRPDGASLPGELVRLLDGIAPAQGERSIVQVCAIRDEANHILQRAGYVASVQIPAQQIDNDGELALNVVTAKLVECGPLTFDSHTGQFELEGFPLKLTALEWRVLSALILSKETVIERFALLERVYEGDADNDSNSLEVIVGRLRKKIGTKLIETVRGRGYRLTAEAS